uniref:Ion transport domain-containing protein n=1 Tax=Zooxanthella nutricula TaxID=1333877 RepID=A0A7S2PCK3_9DINO
MDLKGTGVDVAPWLPQGWPSVLELRQQLSLKYHARAAAAMPRLPMHTSRRLHMDVSKDSNDHAPRRCGQAFISPTSKSHVAYSFLSLFVVIFEITCLPCVLAWDFELTGWLHVIAWGTPIFWTLDIGVNFCTGIFSGGELIMDWRPIAVSYAKNWFAMDFLIALSDWVSLLIGLHSSETIKVVRFTKLGRTIRLVGIIRMVRVIRIVEDIADMWLSEAFRLAGRLGSIFIVIMWAAHFLSCLWFFIGTQRELSDTGATWLDGASVDVEGEHLGFLDAGFLYQYTTSFHWAISQISLGATDSMPSNSSERLVFVFATMMGFLFGSVLVSLLSAGIIDFRISRRDKIVKMRTLRRYLAESNAKSCIARAVTKQVEQRLSIQDKLDERDVHALKLLSRDLLSQLRFGMSKACFEGHPLFRLWIRIDLKCVQRVCDEAISARHFRAKDEVFSAGAEAIAAYAVSQGKFSYTRELATDLDLTDPGIDSMPDAVEARCSLSSEVGTGDWVSEAALWVEWTHVGRLESAADSRMLVIDADLMLRQLLHPAIRMIAREYAVQFHKRLRSAMPPLSSYPSDLVVPRTDYCDLVCAMSQAVQAEIGRQAIAELTAPDGGKMKIETAKLLEEVEAGRSVVVVTGQGLVQRVVPLVVLRLVNSDGALFAKIGRIGDAGCEPSCQLPGAKQDEGETVDETLQRLLASRMSELLADKFELGEGRQACTEVAENESKTLGLRTRYVRTVISAAIKAGQCIDAPTRRCRNTQVGDPPSSPRGRVSVGSNQVLRRFKTPWSGGHSSARRITVRLSVAQTLQCSDFQQRIVWAVPKFRDSEPRAWECYTWLAPEEFDFLKDASGGEPVLASWLSLLVPPEGRAITTECEAIYARPKPAQKTRGTLLHTEPFSDA